MTGMWAPSRPATSIIEMREIQYCFQRDDAGDRHRAQQDRDGGAEKHPHGGFARGVCLVDLAIASDRITLLVMIMYKKCHGCFKITGVCGRPRSADAPRATAGVARSRGARSADCRGFPCRARTALAEIRRRIRRARRLIWRN